MCLLHIAYCRKEERKKERKDRRPSVLTPPVPSSSCKNRPGEGGDGVQKKIHV